MGTTTLQALIHSGNPATITCDILSGGTVVEAGGRELLLLNLP